LKVIFAGTPEFACTVLRQLHRAGFAVPLVLTQPDRPAGRGMQLHESPVKLYARAQGMVVEQPRSLRLDGRFADDAARARDAILAAGADVMVVAAYGLLLPQWVLDAMGPPSAHAGAPALGCINIHASLLPRWRGAAPIHRAIEAGDAETGVTIMQMDAGLDTGDMLLSASLPIVHAGPAADTTGSLHDQVALLGAELVIRALEQARCGGLVARRQPEQGITYAHKVDKSQAEIDWAGNALAIERTLRAFDPSPGAWSTLGGEPLKFWRAEVATHRDGQRAVPGTILTAGPLAIDVACGQGVLRVHTLQRAGGKRLDAASFLRGFALQPGMRFGQPGRH